MSQLGSIKQKEIFRSEETIETKKDLLWKKRKDLQRYLISKRRIFLIYSSYKKGIALLVKAIAALITLSDYQERMR